MTSERKFVMENIRRYLLKEYLMQETKRAGFGGLDIQRTPMGTRVTLTIERPGLVIGRRGGSIRTLERSVEEEFNFDNPKIEVQEENNPSLNAQIMAEKLASALERGWHFRRAGHSTVRRIMDAGAKGCQVVISGKLTGQRHRTEKFKEGHIKFCGEPAIQWMDEGFAVAKRKLGVIGVKVQIMNPNSKLPDDIVIAEEEEVKDKVKPEVVKEEKAVEEPGKEEKKVKKKPKIDEKLEKKLKREKQRHKLPEEESEELEESEEEITEEPEEAAQEKDIKGKEEGVKEEKEEVKKDEPDKKQRD